MALRDGLAHIMQHADTLAQEIHTIYDAGNIFGDLSQGGINALSVPQVYHLHTATDGTFRGNSTETPMNTTGAFAFSCKFRVDDLGANDHCIFISGISNEKLIYARSPEKTITFFDGGDFQHFSNLDWVIGTWYRVDIWSDDAVVVWGRLRALDGSTDQLDSMTQAGGGSTTDGNYRIGDIGVNSRPFIGALAELKWYEAGVLMYDWPLDEGQGLTITERVGDNECQSIGATSTSRWIPSAVHGDWATDWSEAAGFSGGTNQSIISAGQFFAETGDHPPANHVGTILKIECYEANTAVQMSRTISPAEDISGWLTWCPRFYTTREDWSQFATQGYVWNRIRSTDFSAMYTRATQAALSNLFLPGHAAYIFDPNDSTWIVGNASLGIDYQIVGAYDNTNTIRHQIEIKTDTAAQGFTGPASVYFFDWLKDVGHEETSIKVCILWDDGSDTMADNTGLDDSVHGYATTHGIKNTSLLIESAIGNSGIMSSAQIQTLFASGLWEFSAHGYQHVSYETMTSREALEDMNLITAGLENRGFADTTSFRGGSKPFNAVGDTTDGVPIPDVERTASRLFSRRGLHDLFTPLTGLNNPRMLGALAMGQSAGNMPAYADWAAYHTHCKALGVSYIIYGHNLVASSPTGTEILDTDVGLFFADLATDIAAGTVECLFFGEWAEAMGLEL